MSTAWCLASHVFDFIYLRISLTACMLVFSSRILPAMEDVAILQSTSCWNDLSAYGLEACLSTVLHYDLVDRLIYDDLVVAVVCSEDIDPPFKWLYHPVYAANLLQKHCDVGCHWKAHDDMACVMQIDATWDACDWANQRHSCHWSLQESYSSHIAAWYLWCSHGRTPMSVEKSGQENVPWASCIRSESCFQIRSCSSEHSERSVTCVLALETVRKCIYILRSHGSDFETRDGTVSNGVSEGPREATFVELVVPVCNMLG